jgi:hypothetical protein
LVLIRLGIQAEQRTLFAHRQGASYRAKSNIINRLNGRKHVQPRKVIWFSVGSKATV